MKGSGFIIKHLEREDMSTQMDKHTRDNGRMTGHLVRDNLYFQMEPYMRDNLIKVENMV